MATTRREQIITEALHILETNPEGVRYMRLVNMVKESMPELSINTIHGTVWDLHVQLPHKVYKPQKGLFRSTKYRNAEDKPSFIEKEILEKGVKEDSFYKPFADYLENELEDATKAISLGGNKFKDKWGTPDVIGVKKSKRSDIIQFQPEIISAEIKIDSAGLITAFGQACSYKLFSHKVYIVVPKEATEDDRARIESLCLIFGVGLILFNAPNPEKPNFEIRVRPTKHDPDMFYVNKYLKLVEAELFE